MKRLEQKIAAQLAWMCRDFASVDPEPDDESAYREAQDACIAALKDGRLVHAGRDKPLVLTLSLDAWAYLLDEFASLNDRDALPDDEDQARKELAKRRRERKAIDELYAATGAERFA